MCEEIPKALINALQLGKQILENGYIRFVSQKKDGGWASGIFIVINDGGC